jgi:hypothetical protein
MEAHMEFNIDTASVSELLDEAQRLRNLDYQRMDTGNAETCDAMLATVEAEIDKRNGVDPFSDEPFEREAGA